MSEPAASTPAALPADAGKLAILSESFSELSQTFVREHVRAFAAQETVLVSARQQIDEFADRPTLVLGEDRYTAATRLGIFLNGKRIRAFSYPRRLTAQKERDIVEFLTRHQVKSCLVEFGDFAMEVQAAVARAGARLSVYYHGYDLNILTFTSSYRRALRHSFKRIDNAVVGSQMMIDRLIELGCDPAKIVKIPCGMVAPAQVGDNWEWNGGRVIMVSRLIPWKGVDLALESFARVVKLHPDASLDIVGTGKLRERLEAIVEERGIGRNVRFMGGLAHDEVLQAISRSDVLIQHCVTRRNDGKETLGISVLEGMACAKPVVVTRHGAFPETVIDGEIGFIVDEHDIDAMAARVSELLDNPILARDMGLKARSSVIERYGLDRCNALLREHLGFPRLDNPDVQAA